MRLTLYYHPLASYCHKVLIALYENKIEFQARIINLGDAQDKAALQALWPMGKFPVLRDDERQCDIAESTIIIEYLDHHVATANKMIPGNVDDALQVRLWDRIFDNYVQGPMQDIVNDHLQGKKGDVTAAKSMLLTAYGMIDKQLATRAWAAGEQFSLADCAAAPALFFAVTVQAFPQDAIHLSAYFERLVARPSVRRVLEEAKPFLSWYPFSSAMAARFR